MVQHSHDDGAEILRRFASLPRRYADKELMIEFVNDGHFPAASEEACLALSLPLGETVANYTVSVEPGGKHFTLYVCREEAERVLTVPEGSVVNAKVRTVVGVGSESTMLETRTRLYYGLLIIGLK